jgi:hypothetical protein
MSPKRVNAQGPKRQPKLAHSKSWRTVQRIICCEASWSAVGEPAAFGKAGHIRANRKSAQKKELASASACAYNAKHEKETGQLSLAPEFGSINIVRLERLIRVHD